MSVRDWSKDFVSGLTEIDAQHKALFEAVNNFADEHSEKISNTAIVAFLDKLAVYCDEHFESEESMMIKSGYPLVEHHTKAHEDLRNTVRMVKRQILTNKLNNPFKTVIDFVTGWLNAHIVYEDLTFFSFYKSKRYDLGRYFIGRKCRILTINNEPLGMGIIKSVDKSEVVISNLMNARIPVILKDMVKILSFSENKEQQTFIAQVFYSTIQNIKLFNATLVQAVNNRKHFRIETKIDAKMHHNLLHLKSEPYPLIIADISAGGIRIESTNKLELAIDMTIDIEFTVQNSQFKESCIVRRVIKGGSFANSYGMEFTSMKSKKVDMLNSFLFNQQTQNTLRLDMAQ